MNLLKLSLIVTAAGLAACYDCKKKRARREQSWGMEDFSAYRRSPLSALRQDWVDPCAPLALGSGLTLLLGWAAGKFASRINSALKSGRLA